MKKLVSKLLLGSVVQKYSVNASFDNVLEKLEETVKDHSFSVIVVHDMKKTYQSKALNVPEDFEYRIVQICNAAKSNKALMELSYDMGVMMPKSIIVTMRNGITELRFMKLKPSMVAIMFPELEIAPLSKKVSETMEKIVLDTIKKIDRVSLKSKILA